MTAAARKQGLIGLLRSVVLFIVFACAAGSLWLMLRAGHNNGRILPLVILFAMWVLSPFLALVWANGSSGRWSTGTRVTFSITMLVVSLGSLAIYGVNAVHPFSSKGAFIFLVVPAAGWALSAAGLAAARMFAERTPQESRGR